VPALPVGRSDYSGFVKHLSEVRIADLPVRSQPHPKHSFGTSTIASRNL